MDQKVYGKKKNYSPINGTWIAELKAPDFWNAIPEKPTQKASSTIYPNPSTYDEPINIKFYLEKKSVLDLIIYDINGKIVKTLYKGIVKGGNNQLSFSTQHLNSGIYIVSIKDESKVLFTHKFVVEK